MEMVITLHCLGIMTKGSVYVFIQTQCVLVYDPTSPEPRRHKGMAVPSIMKIFSFT